MALIVRCLVAVVTYTYITMAPATAQNLQPNTTWESSRGSEFTIASIDSDGVLKGTYTNRASGFKCQNSPFPLIGWVDGDKISFSVRWKAAGIDCESITAWTGYLAADRIVTNWDLVYMDAAEKRPLIYQGTDFFKIKK